jgi:iron complex transport system substrate-binding protein
MRVVSLLPSATETLFLIGGGDLLVGRSHECDFPAEGRGGGLAAVPVLTGQRIPQGSDPGAIDASVRAQLAGGDSLYTLDAAMLTGLRPDVILTQDLCEVCSIDLKTVRAVGAGMTPPPRIVSLNPHGLEDVFDDILRVGEAVGLRDRAGDAVVGLRERMWRAADCVNPYVDGPSVAFLEWTDPLFIGGHWTPQLIERAGGRHPLNPTTPDADAGDAAGPQAWARKAGKSIRIPEEILVASMPDSVIVCPCGVALDNAREMARTLAQKPWWRDLPAVRAGRVAIVDGNQMFNRPGPRLVDAFEWLVGWINDRPEIIPRDFPWEPWSG